ncbi:MAG: diguanylate cyclase [Planctomycetota bacterium]
MTLKNPLAGSSVLSELEKTLGERLPANGLQLTDATAFSSHPSDSSRVLLGLMALSQKARTGLEADRELLEGVIDGGVLRSLLSALHFRDPATLHHVRRTANVATSLARFLGWDGRHLKVLEVAALLHDMGKIGVPDNVLFKPAVLSPDEAELMSLHYNIGLDVLQACRVDPTVLDFVGSTYSFSDGTGSGFRNINEIPMGARILTIADAYDSLRTEQVYRVGKSHAEAMSVLSQHSGTQFDGNIVAALERCCAEQGPPEYAPGTSIPGANSNSLGPTEALEANTLCHIFNHLYLLESLYDGFYLIDSDMRVVVWNRGLEALLGRPASDMLNRVWTDRELIFGDLQGVPLTDDELPLQRVLATGRAVTTSLQARHADNTWKDIELQTVPLLDSEQRLYGVAGIVRDLGRSGRKPQEFRELRRAATRDALTRLANRGELETQLAIELTKQARPDSSTPFSVIFVDVDHFKSINDTYGHTVGDKVLVELARLMQREMYSGELVARYGGEEFVILCPDAELEIAVARAERLRGSIEKLKIADMPGRMLTASLGVARYETGDSVESLLRRADEALYVSKHAGRNRTNSMTLGQSKAARAAEEASSDADPFLFQSEFDALVSHDMVVYKLGGFVTENNAKLTKVTQTQVVMHIGRVKMIPYWGKDAVSQPIELELNIGERVGGHNPKCVSHNTQIMVQMKPLGWIRQPEIFQHRAKLLFKELRAFFVAETPLT